MPRPTKVPATTLQQAMSLFYHAPIAEAIESLNAVNALVVERANAENYVPVTAAQDPPARPRAPRSPSPTGRPRGRPPAAKPPVTAVPPTPSPPVTPPGGESAAPSGDPPVAPGDPGGAPEGGSLTMPPLGGTAPTTPVPVPGGRAPTT